MSEHDYLADCFYLKAKEWADKLAQAIAEKNWERVETLRRELDDYQEQEGKMRAEAARRRAS